MQRHIEFERPHNFRDLGGYVTDDGRSVRWGRLYRSDGLYKLRNSEQDWAKFLSMDIRTVIDLRYDWEIGKRGRIPEDDSFIWHNLSIEHQPYNQAALDPATEIGRFLADRYLEVAEDGVKEIKQVIEIIAEGPQPAVFHCAAGKDRTGIIAALVLGLIGVSEQDIVADFALTGLATERFLADYSANPLNAPIVWPGYGTAPAEIMEIFLGDLKARYGSIRGYAEARLGVDDKLVEALQRRLLTAPEGPMELNDAERVGRGVDGSGSAGGVSA